MTNRILYQLTDAARTVYDKTEPLDVIETATDDGPRYTITGALELDGLTSIEEVSRALEDWSEEIGRANI